MENTNNLLLEKPSTKWFKTEQISTFIESAGHKETLILIVNHQCGDDKEALISQLKSLINGLETNFEYFGS